MNQAPLPRYYHPCDLPHSVTMPKIGRLEVAAILFAKLGLFVGFGLALLASAVLGVRTYAMLRQQKVEVNLTSVAQAEEKLSRAEGEVRNATLAIAHANYALRNTQVLNSLFARQLADTPPYELKQVMLKAYPVFPSPAGRSVADKAPKAPERRDPMLGFHVQFEWLLTTPSARETVDSLALSIVKSMRPDFRDDSAVVPWTLTIQGAQNQSAVEIDGKTKLVQTGELLSPETLYQPRKGVRPTEARGRLESFYIGGGK